MAKAALGAEVVNTSYGPGGGPTTTTKRDVNAAYLTGVYIEITNGATGPTNAAEVQVRTYAAGQTKAFNKGTPFVGSTSNSAVVSVAQLEIPMDADAWDAVITHPTGQAVTVAIHEGKVNTIS